VAHNHLPNYLRRYRRRIGFLQKELAMLIGLSSGTKVSSHENFAREPSAAAIFAYEIVFGQPASELFRGSYEAIREAVRQRALDLLNDLLKEPIRGPNAARIKFLQQIVDQKPFTLRNAN
jgi:transcriptional regulator with XRE-family HTH domain